MGRQKTQLKPHLKPSPLANVKLEMAKKKAAAVPSKSAKSKKKK